MYWEINKPAGIAVLEEFNTFFKDFFEFAASQRSYKLDAAACKARFPVKGAWILEKLKRSEIHSGDLSRSVNALFSMEPAKRRQIADALCHDLCFDKNGNGSFFYQIPNLTRDAVGVVRTFYLHLYKSAFYILGLGPNHYNRKSLAEDFVGSNGQLHSCCPVCLHYITDMAKECDLEHYFPKKEYPFLSMHPGNLYLACKACNQVYKKNKEVLKGKDQRMVFIPYLENAKGVSDITIVRKRGKDTVKLHPENTSSPFIEKKLENFEEQYGIQKRWTKELEHFYSRFAIRYRGLRMNRGELEKRVKEDLKLQAVMWEMPEQYVEGVYLKWIAGHQMDALYRELNS